MTRSPITAEERILALNVVVETVAEELGLSPVVVHPDAEFVRDLEADGDDLSFGFVPAVHARFGVTLSREKWLELRTSRGVADALLAVGGYPRAKPVPHPWAQDAGVLLRLGLGLASGMVAGIVLGGVAKTSWELPDATSSAYWAVFNACSLMGVVIGLGLPRVTTELRALLVGAWAASPVFLTFGLAVPALRPHLGKLLVLGVVIGGLVGQRTLLRWRVPLDSHNDLGNSASGSDT